MNESTPAPDQLPLDAAVAAFLELSVPACPASDEWVERLSAAAANAQTPTFDRRRLLMRVVTLSSAAAIVAAGATMFLAGPASVALGDVIKAAEQHKLVKYSKAQHVETKDGTSVQPQVVVAYADLTAPRFRADERTPSLQGAIDFESIFVQDGKKGVTMHRLTETVTEKGKTDPEAIKVLKDFEKLGVPRKIVTLTGFHGDMTPATGDKARSILENLRELEKHKNAVASKGKLRGADVLKYRVEDGQKTTLLWVDATTKLPVRLEYESTDPNDLGRDTGVTKTKIVLSDFEWDPELKGFSSIDELFSVTPTEGYQVNDLRQAKAGADK